MTGVPPEKLGRGAARLRELFDRRRAALEHGGSESVARHRALGRLTARDRLDVLLDEGSFREFGSLTGTSEYDDSGEWISTTPASVVTGSGRVDGRPIVVVSDDFTVRGGSSESTSPDKWQFAERHALERGVPLVRLVESAGGSVRLLEKERATKIPGYPRWPLVDILGTVPVVAAAMGACAGLGAVRVTASHFSVMVEDSQVFAAGPQVVAPGTGQVVSKDELGGPGVHVRGSGVVDNLATDEADAMSQVRRFLSYLPTSVYELPPCQECHDPADRDEEWLRTSIPDDPRRVYKVRPIIESLVDKGSFFEIGPNWGGGTVTVLARLGGRPVGIMANDPRVAGGAMTERAAQKTQRFVDMCDTFHVPILNMVDQPGVSVGVAAEQRGTIREATRAFLAIQQVRVPWMTLIIRRVFGMAGMAHAPGHRALLRLAWPSAHWGSIPVDGGVEAAHRRELAESEDPGARLEELLTYYRAFESPFRTAERFGVEEIIDPAVTRRALCEWAEDAYRILPQQVGQRTRTMRV